MGVCNFTPGFEVNVIASVLLYTGKDRVDVTVRGNRNIGTSPWRAIRPVVPVIPIGVFRTDFPSGI